MPSPIYGGSYVYYYNFPSQLDLDFVPLSPQERYPTITSEEDQYSIESTRFSEYLSKIKIECGDKMAWLMNAVPAALESLEDVISLKQICNYLNTSDFWKKDGDWPEQVDEEQLRSFNIEVVRNWLFQNTARHFYEQNQDTLPSVNAYKMQLAIYLEQIKQGLLALDALYLMKSHLNSYLVGLWESFNPGSRLDKFKVFNISAITEKIEEKGLFPNTMQLIIHSGDFEYWQQVHRELVHELIIIINRSILDELKKKCSSHGFKVPFEQLYTTYWPTSKRLDDYSPPLRSLPEINEFMEKVALAEQKRLRIIEEKRKEWNGSPAGFEVAMERAQSILGSRDASHADLMQIFSEQLKKIAAEDEVVESLSLVNKNPIEIVTKILHKERVDEVATLAPVIVRDIQHVIEHMPDKPTFVDYSKNVQALDQFVVGVRSACNRAALIDLYDRLEQSTNKQIAEKMIGDWDVVGTDIRDSERMMTESDKLRIIAYAQGKMTKQEYKEEMSKLNVKLERGEITAQEEVVIKMFPKLKRALTRLPKEYLEDFSLVLKRAFVHQQITHPEKFLQNPHEAAVFSALGLDSSKVKVNKELVQQKIKHVIQNAVLNGQSEHEFPTLKELQHQIELMALREKISAAGGDPSLAPLIHKVTSARQEVLTTATHLLEQAYEHCKKELNDANKNISQHIDSSLKQAKSRLLRTLSRSIDQKIKKNQDSLIALTDQYEKVKEMISPLNDQSSSTFHASLLSDVKKDINFFNQWGDPIQYENIQGFIGGISEVLGDGACQANTYRVITREMTSLGRNKELSDSQWNAEVKISPQDRYNQALYQVDARDEANNGLSKAVLKRLHLKKIQALHKDFHYADEPALSSDSIYQVLFQAVNEQQKSKLKNFGIVKLSIGHHATKKDGTQAADQETWGHAIYLRYDPKKKIAYFYDPNHGRSINFYTWKKLESDTDFKKMGQKEQDETVLNYMLLCFSQMMVNDFNDINTVRCYEMEMDFSFIDKLVSAGNSLIGGLNNFFKKKKEPDIQIENMTVNFKSP
ncbi:Uncharacterised protein [Legionella steigerwaltii]|uniref:Uncharacterized protein n=1 Tax=Legionella steigerwaltii TaxID=460 RepID=A0A378L8Q8_9GAMM|nr:hypothetical protein [Legionella steigerwaltii]KTD81086.1 hypothetical protein Lstg_0313 [Legionella steigerwaltii]STY23226.1 Uncharacterised protein [Legionella steigerwaltii]